MAFSRTRLAIVCTVCYLAALVVYLVGFSMSYWVTDYSGKEYHFGLWQYCAKVGDEGKEECIYVVNYEQNHKAYLRATQAFEVMSLACALAGLVLCFLWIKYSDKRKYPLLAGVVVLAAALLSFLALIIFGAEFKKWNHRPPNGWGFWVIMLASIIFFLQGMAWLALVFIPSFGFNYRKEPKADDEMHVPRNYKPPSHPAGLY